MPAVVLVSTDAGDSMLLRAHTAAVRVAIIPPIASAPSMIELMFVITHTPSSLGASGGGGLIAGPLAIR
jgi:hypothetical protein